MSDLGRPARLLKSELLRRLLLPMAAILLVSGVLSYQLAMRFADSSYDRSLIEDVRALARQSGSMNGRGLHALPKVAIDMLDPGGGDRVFAQVRSRTRGVLAGDPELPSPPEGGAVDAALFNAVVRNEKVRIAVLSLSSPDADDLMLLLGETRRRRDSMAGDIVAAVVLPQLALMLLAVVVIVSGVSSGLAPLESLARGILARRRDDLAPLPTSDVPGEVVSLIAAFNGLLARLTEAQEVQRRFVADAAHQLRTPLAALKIQVDQARRTEDAAQRTALLGELSASVERMARLSGQLLLLTRAEPGGSALVRRELDLAALAREVGSQWVPRAIQCGRDLGLDAPEHPVPIVGDALMLGELIGNLIDNALRYGGGKVTLRVAEADQGSMLEVEDDGPGIPDSERRSVFARFHRVPGTTGEGSGLGLAIVAEIAAAHNAMVELKTPDHEGFCVSVRFAGNQHIPGETG